MASETSNLEEHSVRLATLADLPEVLELVALLYADEHLQFHADRCQAALQCVIEQDHLGFVLVATIDSRPIAYAVVTFCFSIEFGGRFALLDEIFVERSRRGCGLGTALLVQVAAECTQREVHSIRLEVESNNERAQNLYQRHGFVKHDRHLMTRWLVARA
jgi:ribosomal protein S18 acetylase RimI-like enzyme